MVVLLNVLGVSGVHVLDDVFVKFAAVAYVLADTDTAWSAVLDL
jgi:hypothetical protein